jgi:hypothetical protein
VWHVAKTSDVAKADRVRNPLAGATCSTCRGTLSKALVREVRHYEETRLVEITCVFCERSFLAIWVDAVAHDAIGHEDVATAAAMLADAQRLSDIMNPRDLGLEDAA